MISIRPRRRLAVAGVIAAAALGSAGTAQATPTEQCDARLDRLEAKFLQIEEKRGWEEAVEWWPAHWKAYYERCEV